MTRLVLVVVLLAANVGCLDVIKTTVGSTATATNNNGTAPTAQPAKVTAVRVTFDRAKLPRAGVVTATAAVTATCGADPCAGSQLQDLLSSAASSAAWSIVSGPGVVAETQGARAKIAAQEEPLPALGAGVRVQVVVGGLAGDAEIVIGPAD